MHALYLRFAFFQPHRSDSGGDAAVSAGRHTCLPLISPVFRKAPGVQGPLVVLNARTGTAAAFLTRRRIYLSLQLLRRASRVARMRLTYRIATQSRLDQAPVPVPNRGATVPTHSTATRISSCHPGAVRPRVASGTVSHVVTWIIPGMSLEATVRILATSDRAPRVSARSHYGR